MRQGLSVEEVSGRKALTRFIELPHALSGGDPRWAPMVLAWERYRLDPHRNAWFDAGDAQLFLVRRLGRPAGRIVAHLARPGAAGRFGFWWVDDDADVAAALLEAAQAWLQDRGCTDMTGPWSFTADDEPGVQVHGHGRPGVTGRPWHPPHLARLLEGAGLLGVEDQPTWRLAATVDGPVLPLDGEIPGQAGAYADPRLVLQGIAAVPDVADALRTPSLRSTWTLARRARERAWETATVVRCPADPAAAVPALLGAAGRAGYTSVIAPWSPDPDAVPDAVHRIYRLSW